MRIVVGEVIDHAGLPCVHVATSEGLRIDAFARGGLHQRRAPEEDRALFAHDDRLVAHRRDVRATCRTRTHHHGQLRNPARRHLRLVVENAAEVLAVGKDVVLPRQERAARIDEVDAGQTILERHFLRAQVLAHGDGVVRAALHGRVVADDDAFETRHTADASHDSPAGNPVVVQVVSRELADLEEGRARIEQPVDAIAHQQLVAALVLGTCRRGAACADLRGKFTQFGGQATIDGLVGRELGAMPVDTGLQHAHASSLPLRSARISGVRARPGCAPPA